MQRVHIIMRSLDYLVWLSDSYTKEDIQIVYCGYLEFPDNVDVSKEETWKWCNWSCRSFDAEGNIFCPKECEHLLITHCNEDMAYFHNNKWYAYDGTPFASLEQCWNTMTSVDQRQFNHLFSSLHRTPKRAKLVTIENLKKYIYE